ncbi:MAG TPA: D-aminoacylase [Actinopolymorphaceae bacterium]
MTEAILLEGGAVVDGSGAGPRSADVLVVDGKIEAVGRSLAGYRTAERIDVRDAYVLPGFVDVHAHDDLAVFTSERLEPKLRQGVTLDVVGNCGHGGAPTSTRADLSAYSAPILGGAGGSMAGRRWPAFSDYLEAIAQAPRATHVAALVPHGPLRAAVLGVERRPATRAEVGRMTRLLDEALAAGAVGLSLGLMYPPGNAAGSDELRALAETVGRHGKLLVAHVRNEADRILDSIAELAELGLAGGCPVHVSHLKVTSPANHGRMPEVLEALEGWRRHGVDVTADVYPYVAGSTTAATLFPPWAADRGLDSLLGAMREQRDRIVEELLQPWGDLENYFRSLGPERIHLGGASLAAHAAERGQDAADCLVDLVQAAEGNLPVVLFQQSETDIRTALSWPYTMIGSDGLPLPSGPVHPRLYGTFPRVLSRYTGPTLGWGEAVRRMTSLPAARFGFPGRGTICAGGVADLVVVRPDRLEDTATYDDPRRFPHGVELVLVGGAPAWQPGRDLTTRGGLVRTVRAGLTR